MFEYLGGIELGNRTFLPDDWEERDGKLWLDFGDRPLTNGDSILLISKDDEKWRSRRVVVGPGGCADLYFHPDVLAPPVVTGTRPRAKEQPMSEVERLRKAIREAADILDAWMDHGDTSTARDLLREALNDAKD